MNPSELDWDSIKSDVQKVWVTMQLTKSRIDQKHQPVKVYAVGDNQIRIDILGVKP